MYCQGFKSIFREIGLYFLAWTKDELRARHHRAAHLLPQAAHHCQGKTAPHGLTKHSHLASLLHMVVREKEVHRALKVADFKR